MADTQAAPLLEKLKSDPNNSSLLSEIGNLSRRACRSFRRRRNIGRHCRHSTILRSAQQPAAGDSHQQAHSQKGISFYVEALLN